MGSRKRERADRLKSEKSQIAIATLKDSPIAPRKMRLVADLIRGVEVNKALNILQHNSKFASKSLEKLLRSAIANWEAKNEDQSLDDANLVVSTITVDGGTMLKRIRPRAQGRANRIRKRSNHVTIIVGGTK